MGVEPPFIYDKPSVYTFDGPTGRTFNPKAATHASWAPKPPKPTQDGPLINFNRHPDSYYQSPYGNTNAVPMNPKTKGHVQFAWTFQRVVRALALLGAMGAVFCIVAIRGTSTAVGWTIRVGPAVVLAHTLYATYFLCRSISSRPPASCASYQLFAGLLDTGLLPILGFTFYMAFMENFEHAYGWSTVFSDDVVSAKIIQAFMILCAAEIGLLAVSWVLDIYLAVIYRKISNSPPDMNPLEDRDNLTARPHHKRNKSELVYEKHLSNSTLASERLLQMAQNDARGRRVPFKHTRTDSADTDRFSVRHGSYNSGGNSFNLRASMSPEREGPAVSRPTSAMMPAANARPAGAGLDNKPARSSGLARSTTSRPNSWASFVDYEGVPPVTHDYPYHGHEMQDRSMSPVSAISDHENCAVPTTHVQGFAEPQNTYAPSLTNSHFQVTNDQDRVGFATPPAYTTPKKRSREPLGMNPPTPVNQQFRDESLMVRPLSVSTYATPPRQALRETEPNSVTYATPASRPSSFVGSGTKGRFYGDLRNSLAGSPTRGNQDDLDDLHRSGTIKTDDSGNFEVYDSESEDEYDPYRAGHGEPVMVGHGSPGRQWNGQRQISDSTGYDLHAGYAGLDQEFGKGMATRRREVSGKAAEEGRSYEAAVASVAQAETRPGAAGWARFKGL